MKDHPPCPNCNRPIGWEYSATENGKCQLWRLFNEHGLGAQFSSITIRDCFRHTTERLALLNKEIEELRVLKDAAQRALNRRHGVANTKKDA